MPAPICLFVYNRPAETARLLNALHQCPESTASTLYIFSDGPKTDTDKADVDQVRDLLSNIDGFARIHIFSKDTNAGLSASIIHGVSTILKEHDSVIVLEDDLEMAPDFLTFMNKALETYKERHDIWSISGYTPNIPIPADYPYDVFLVQRPQCWGWATWGDRWELIDWNAKQSSILSNRKQRRSFNQGGNDLYRTLDMWQHGRIDTWAIRWVFAAWLQHCWTVNPIHSKIKNTGFSTAATHHGWHDCRHIVELNYLQDKHTEFISDIHADPRICKSFKRHHDLGIISSIGYFMRRYGLGYHFAKRILGTRLR
ncbi:MAG: glycosyltransferase [Bacteroidales bacterium]|nr:glycosyltransferase [Bacteroidales bacterium]